MPYKDPETRRAKQKIYRARWRAKRTPEQKDMHRAHNREYIIARNLALIEEARTRPCIDCGFYHPGCMHLDHVRGEKLFYVNVNSSTLRKGRAVLEAEIAKCDSRCANCHGIRHWKERQ